MTRQRAPVVVVALALAAGSGLGACAPATITHVQRYPDGRPRWEYTTRNNVPVGVQRVWHPNGTLRSEGPYVNGKKHGVFEVFTETGSLESTTVYRWGVETWRSATPREAAPPEVLAALADPEPVPTPPSFYSRRSRLRFSAAAPEPYFATLDRTTGTSRAGVQLGFSGGNGTNFGSATRLELFGNVVHGRYGGYGQVSETVFKPAGEAAVGGRRTLELGATRSVQLGAGNELTARLGALIPVGHADADGFYASAAGASQRTADAAETMPSPLGIRSGASYVRHARRLVMQADGGVDWMLGTAQHSLDPLVRLDAGIGLGVRSTIFALELASTMNVREPSHRLHTAAASTTVWFDGWWLTAAVALSQHAEASLIGTVGYGL